MGDVVQLADFGRPYRKTVEPIRYMRDKPTGYDPFERERTQRFRAAREALLSDIFDRPSDTEPSGAV